MLSKQDTSRQIVDAASSAATPLDGLFQATLHRVLARIRSGRLDVISPNGDLTTYGQPDSDLRATLRVQSTAFQRKTVLGADLGFGESYVDGDWETDDLTAVLRVFGRNQDLINERSMVLSHLRLWIDRAVHLWRDNTAQGARRNIAYHYDLSNPFYELMLDPTMTYSCALWKRPEESLEQAQHNKLAGLISKLHVESHHHVLEIGSGWGAMAIELVKRTGCRVTTITLSERQLETVRERVAAAGLTDRITPMLCDYRTMQGQFDRILSVEMLEAVGEKYLPVFFECCDQLLKPDGIAVIQVITMPDHRYENYRKGCDWIQRYIFPGCLVPSVGALASAIVKSSKFVIHDLENIGIHYARTLREWRHAVHAHRTEMFALGFDERFLRMWDYYLCYCEAGFEERILGTHQLVLTRPGNLTLPVYT
jgi:cyclopropane-fatty-acyl-phospholipid synthase